VNPVEEVIRMYKNGGPGTNQATMEVGMPQDIVNSDPPCLRLIDTRVRYGKLHFVVYFRSWDLWAGFPANLAGIQLLKEYMAQQIGVEMAKSSPSPRACTSTITGPGEAADVSFLTFTTEGRRSSEGIQTRCF
jgi:hypothetical protein